jgi:sec-independent protein translocase protein TatC
VIAALLLSLLFTDPLWDFVQGPGRQALLQNGAKPELFMIDPMDGINIIWFKLPVVCAIFLSAPWILYQVWGFVSPGLYRRERRWALPFILSAAGLFLLGGLFGHFVVFRYALTFLLGIGKGKGVATMLSVTAYFDRFVDVILGVGIAFELPVIVFSPILFGITTPGFLLRHSRYAILIIFTVASVVTPTTDVTNMLLVAVPMCFLFYAGILGGSVLLLKRQGRRVPWRKIAIIGAAALLVSALTILAVHRLHLEMVPRWPFLLRAR